MKIISWTRFEVRSDFEGNVECKGTTKRKDHMNQKEKQWKVKRLSVREKVLAV